MTEPWPREEFERRLRQAARERYHDKHSFNRRMHDGALAEHELRSWVYNRFHYQRNLPVKDALILAKLPSSEQRRAWIGRIVEQDGDGEHPGGLESWLELALSVGLTREATLAGDDVLPGVRFAVGAYVDFCRQREWWEGVAASLTQLEVPRLMETRLAAFERHYDWVPSTGLDYFRRRRDIEPEHADHALEMVVAAARSRAEQERAVAAVEYKCDVLSALLDAVETDAQTA